MQNALNKKRPRLWQWLLALPYVAVLFVGFYNQTEPSLFGMPFFYWFQLLLIPISSLIIVLVYKAHQAGQADR